MVGFSASAGEPVAQIGVFRLPMVATPVLAVGPVGIPSHAPEGFCIETLVVGAASGHCSCEKFTTWALLSSSIAG